MGLHSTILNSYVLKREPMSLIHFITNRCNARCKHCFIDFDSPETFTGELTIDEIKKLAAAIGGSIYNINLTGGEPFIRRDIFEIAEAYYSLANVKSIFITTNGCYTEWTKEFIDKFIASPFSSRNLVFSFSIDNFEEKHDENRRVKGLFSNVINTYNLVNSYNKPNIMANIAITVTQHNYDNVIELYYYLKKELGVRGVTATAMREEGVVAKIPAEIKAKIHEAYAKLVGIIKEDMIRGSMGYNKNLQGSLMNSKNMIANEIINQTYLDPHYVSHCPAAALFGVITPNGDVYPCEILNKKMGNLRDYDMNLMNLWNNEATKAVKKFIKDIDCNCTYECAMSINIIANKKFIPRLISNSLRQKIGK